MRQREMSEIIHSSSSVIHPCLLRLLLPVLPSSSSFFFSDATNLHFNLISLSLLLPTLFNRTVFQFYNDPSLANNIVIMKKNIMPIKSPFCGFLAKYSRVCWSAHFFSIWKSDENNLVYLHWQFWGRKEGLGEMQRGPSLSLSFSVKNL